MECCNGTQLRRRKKGGMVVCDDKYNNIQSNDTMIMTYLVWKPYINTILKTLIH